MLIMCNARASITPDTTTLISYLLFIGSTGIHHASATSCGITSDKCSRAKALFLGVSTMQGYCGHRKVSHFVYTTSSSPKSGD